MVNEMIITTTSVSPRERQAVQKFKAELKQFGEVERRLKANPSSKLLQGLMDKKMKALEQTWYGGESKYTFDPTKP